MDRYFWILLLCSGIASADSPSAADITKTVNNTASILVLDAKWPKSANRVLLKPDSPMPVATYLFDASGLKCSVKDEIVGAVRLKLKNGKKRAPVAVAVPAGGKIRLLFMQTFNAATGGIYHQAYAQSQKTCYRILTIDAVPQAVYGVEMLFNGENCSLSVSNSVNEPAPASYKEFKEATCRDGQILYYR